jgi:hypothetical protein
MDLPQQRDAITGDRSTVKLCPNLASHLGMKSEDKLACLPRKHGTTQAPVQSSRLLERRGLLALKIQPSARNSSFSISMLTQDTQALT